MDEKQETYESQFGKRHIQVMLMFLVSATAFAMRSAMSVAVVAMTTNSTSSYSKIPTFDWTNTSVILSSFYWGYAWLQVSIGHYGKKYGTKYIFLICFTLSTLLFMLIPLAAVTVGSIGVIVCRTLQGLTQGCLVPSIHVMTGTWMPVEERTRSFSIICTGYALGSILGSLITGYISKSIMGWPAVFYILGGAGLISMIFWWIFMENGPSSHPHITIQERKYIEASLQESNKICPTPWKSIFTNIPFYSIFAVYIGFNFTMALSTEMPTYLNKVWKFETSMTGLLTSIPTILNLIMNTPFGILADILITRKFFSISKVRKMFQCASNIGVAICLLCYCVIPLEHQTLFIAILFILPVFSAICVSGAMVNLTDISPRFCGVMGGFCNAVSQIFTSLAPLLVQFLVTDQTKNSQWAVVFLINVGILVTSCILFAVYGSGERQPFDDPSDDPDDPISKKIRKISVLSMIS